MQCRKLMPWGRKLTLPVAIIVGWTRWSGSSPSVLSSSNPRAWPSSRGPEKGIEGGLYPNVCSATKNAPKSTKEFYPTSLIETKSRPSENRQTGNWDPPNGPDCIKMLA